MIDKDKNLDRELFDALEKEFAEPSFDRMESMRRKILADIPKEKSIFNFSFKNILAYATAMAMLLIITVSIIQSPETQNTQTKSNKQFSTMLENEKQLDLMVAVLSDFAEEETDNNLWEYVDPNNNWVLFEADDYTD